MYYLGIDISKKSFTVSVLDEEGEAISKVLTFPCTGGFEKLVDKISSLKLKKSEVVIGIEATGRYLKEKRVNRLLSVWAKRLSR